MGSLDSFRSGYRQTEDQNPTAVGRNDQNSEKNYDQGKGDAYHSSAHQLTDRKFLLEHSRTTACGSCSHVARERRRIYVSAKQFGSRLNMIPFSSFCWRHEEDLRKVEATRVRKWWCRRGMPRYKCVRPQECQPGSQDQVH